MITTAFFTMAASSLNWVLGFLPAAATFPADAHTAASALGGYLGILSPIAPISTLLTLVGLVLTIELSLFAFRSFRWVASHLPYIGGKGV